MPVSVLSDFEEFTIYDCRIQPRRFDPASKGRLEYYQYPDYVNNWDKLYGLFSREAVADGALRDWIGEEKTRGALGVDQAFLREMEIWREDLAKDIALHNDLSQRDLNHLVQRTIDRLVFLRIAEDRGIEIYGRLRSIAGEGRQVYQGLKLLFIEADDKYNSGLFHFGHEERGSAPDRLSLSIHISDDTLRQIIKNLYYPNSPYEFSVLPADILGQVYERFLGKVIELTDTGLARVEDKPEVRKAGGVYYTPTYIVDYIVENTVGKLLEGKTPKEAEKLRILDPACGSGSFLTGAYQCLLNWHLNYYSQEPERHRNTLRRRVDGYVLTTQEKRRILQNNIYGVDLDQNAVEVSKLSLLLKMLENEDGSDATGLQTAMFAAGGCILPDLSNNIKWGNSLIGSDFYTGKQMGMFSEEEVLKVKAFDWESREHGFGEIVAAGGFDAVIGNPPYIRSQSLGKAQTKYYKNVFRSATRTYDIYVLFVERGIGLVRDTGRVGFILPNKFFTTDYGEGLRHVLADQLIVDRIVDFEDGQVFPQAGTYTALLFLSYRGSLQPEYKALGSVFREHGLTGVQACLASADQEFESILITDDGSRWTLAPGRKGQLLARLREHFPPLTNMKPHVFQGLKTSADKTYMVTVKRIGNDGKCTVVNGFGQIATLEIDILRPVVKGEMVKRYSIDTSRNLFIIYPYSRVGNNRALILSGDHLAITYPNTWEYLNQHREVLGTRDKGKWSKRDDWYAYARSQNIVAFLGKKFMLPYMTRKLRLALDEMGDKFFVNITTGGYGLRLHQQLYDDRFWLGIFNSRLMDWTVKLMTNRFRGGYFAINKQAIERLPVRAIDFDNPADVAMHDQMVELVERMLDLQKQSQQDNVILRGTIELQIERTDREIDELVYKLYDLTTEEIAIVEGRGS